MQEQDSIKLGTKPDDEKPLSIVKWLAGSALIPSNCVQQNLRWSELQAQD